MATAAHAQNNAVAFPPTILTSPTNLTATKALTPTSFPSLTSSTTPTSLTPLMPPASTSAAKKPSYAEVARRSSLKSPETLKPTPYTPTSTRCRTPPPIPWHTKPRTPIKPVLYMTMEDLFRKFTGKHLASLTTATPSSPQTVPAVASSQLGMLSPAAISISTSRQHAGHTPSSTGLSRNVFLKLTTARRTLSMPVWEWTRHFGLRLRAWVRAKVTRTSSSSWNLRPRHSWIT